MFRNLKVVFEKIEEYIDEDTPTYEYIQNMLNFIENVKQGEDKIDPETLKNILTILTGNAKPHPAVEEAYELEEEPEEEENQEISEEEPKNEENQEIPEEDKALNKITGK